MSDTETPKSAASASETPLGTVKGLLEEHPVAMLAGGILLGALVAGVLSRKAKKAPANKPRRSFGQRAAQIATLGAELAAAYAAGAGTGPVEADPAHPAQAAKPPVQRFSTFASTALRTLAPVIGRLGGKTRG